MLLILMKFGRSTQRAANERSRIFKNENNRTHFSLNPEHVLSLNHNHQDPTRIKFTFKQY